MRRHFTALLVMLVLMTAVGFADEPQVLIDFELLKADLDIHGTPQNERTLTDYGNVAGTSFTNEQKAAMKTSLELNNWDVKLCSSSRTVARQSMCQVTAVTVNPSATKYGDKNVLGVRIHFPESHHNSWAIVQPPFAIPAYADVTEYNAEKEGTTVPAGEEGKGNKFVNVGVLKNVGPIKYITVNVLGRNFPHGLSIVLEDENYVERQIFMGYLRFDGWNSLTWRNPNYVEEVKNRELRLSPMYPNANPVLKFKGFILHRDADHVGGDFVTYIRDVQVAFDKATLDLQKEVDDEEIWHIQQKREEHRRQIEAKKLGHIQVLRYLEKQKQFQGEEE